MRPESMRGDTVLALDIGTSSVRTLVFDRRGHVIQGVENQIEYGFTATPDGGAFVDAKLLLDLTATCIDGAIEPAMARGIEIGAVGISCFWHSLLGLDEQGEPTTPVLLWADTRAADQVEQLRREHDQRAIHAQTGCVLHSSYWPAKLRWLQAVDPVAFARTVRWCAFSDHLLQTITGVDFTTVSMASGTGMLAVREAAWDPEMIRIAGVDPGTMPPIATDECVRGMTAEFAARWPALRDATWVGGIGDGAAANLGTGAVNPDRIALSLGTSGAIRILIEHAPGDPLEVPDALWAYRLDRAHVLLGAAISNGGKTLAWLLDLLGADFDGTEAIRAAKLEPDGHGLTFLPFLAGERSPIWNDRATGIVAGLTLSTGRAELIRCGWESVAMRFARLYAGLRTVAAPRHEIVANGAALLRSETWLQITADTLAHPVLALPPAAESSARGAAVYALAATGAIEGIGAVEDPVSEAMQVLPIMKNAERYKIALARQTALESLLFPSGRSWQDAEA